MRCLAALTAGLAVLAVGTMGCRPSTPVRAVRPNVVLVVIDTLRRDRLPMYGHGGETTPFLASLAERAVVFERAHSTSSWTSPATVSLLTSLFPFQHGVEASSLVAERGAIEIRRIPDTVETLAETLAGAGYRTFAVVDNRNVSAKAGFARGFERFEETDYASADVVGETLDRWRSDLSAAAPYFLYVHYMDPHIPYHAREPWYAAFAASSPEPDAERRDALARYDSEIRFVDEHLRAVFERSTWESDAIVIVTSDHGEEFGDHGGTQHGNSLYAEVIDVPLLVRHPSRWQDGRRVGVRVSLVDLAPTILDLAGLPPNPAYVGRTLVPVMDGVADAGRSTYTHLVHPSDAPGGGGFEVLGIIDGDLKFLDYDDRPDQLFDLPADPADRHDVAAERPDVAAALATKLERFVAEAPRFEPGRADVPLSPKQIEKLRTLGYLK